jgi:hypothetical protein
MSFIKLSILVFFITIANTTSGQSISQLTQFTGLIQTLIDNDFKAFKNFNTGDFNEVFSHKDFVAVQRRFGPLLKTGFSAEYLTDLTQNGAEVLVWKVSFEASEDQLLVKTVMDEDKYTGIWIH